MDSEVIIVGAGPVGLTLAIDLGRRGVRTTLIERKAAPEFLPKMERCNARTMEIYRRMGLSERIRAAGLAADVPMDVFVVLNLAEPPLLHLPYPSVAAAKDKIAAVNDGTAPAEPYQLISQYTLEPLLKAIAEALPAVSVRYGTEFLSLAQNAEGVSAEVVFDGRRETLGARYLVGCDGGASAVRKQLGIQLHGDGSLLELSQALFRCEGLFDRIPIGNGPGHGRHYHVADDHAGFLIMQDSTKHFTFHATLKTADEMKRRFEEVIAVPLDYEMLSCNPWRQNLLLADRYRDGRVFLAGDAVHLVTPSGGLGMNTGVGDANDLGWKLAAVLRGWGGEGLLYSYEVERRQIGDRNVGASRYATIGRRTWRAAWRPEITAKTPEGQAVRDNLAKIADVEQRKTNEMVGAELGYRYLGSPVIAEEEGGPDQPLMAYEPTSWPGARLPHVRLKGGRPIQDAIPADGFTLLRLGGTQADGSGLEQALRRYGAPAAVLDLTEEAPREVYGYDLILLRPDLHVVWRGNAAPDDPTALAAKVTGH